MLQEECESKNYVKHDIWCVFYDLHKGLCVYFYLLKIDHVNFVNLLRFDVHKNFSKSRCTSSDE